MAVIEPVHIQIKKAIKVTILKAIACLLTVALAASATAQDWHPGKMGEDAPGGKVVKIPSSDIHLHGVIYYPPQPTENKKLPAVIIVHGWAPYDARAAEPYTYVAKEYAEHGFIAMAITLRGWPQTGGKDDCGLTQPQDVARAAQWLSKQPQVDPTRIGLMGQSLGGQVALLAAGLSKTIKATAAYFPITDFRLWGVTTNLPQAVLDDYIFGMCKQNGTPEARSPLNSAHKIHGAVLLLHGDMDTNVIVAHSKLLQQLMHEAKQDVRLYVAKGGGHGSGGKGWENHNQIVYDFFSQKLH